MGRRRPVSSDTVTASVVKEMAELISLDVQIAQVLAGWAGDERHPLHDLQVVALEADELPRVVGHDADRGETEVAQDLRADAVVPKVGREAQALIGLDGVGA